MLALMELPCPAAATAATTTATATATAACTSGSRPPAWRTTAARFPPSAFFFLFPAGRTQGIGHGKPTRHPAANKLGGKGNEAGRGRAGLESGKTHDQTSPAPRQATLATLSMPCPVSSTGPTASGPSEMPRQRSQRSQRCRLWMERRQTWRRPDG
ncbi:hypothetical protein B0H67DRAFT_584960 [Lasiosphaeris hirsuta]|uniref:Uncharacterized protein n=1 Tax=Lasiosphaeris hirsuta TaxID=260670 RepID=A0AA40A8X4_9PEZI|nr:hypothetical protein B0H67DRAFT_584960 [Lasiosphaeris hirsuta]